MSQRPYRLAFAPFTRWIRKERQTLLLDLESRKWVRLTTPGFDAIRALVEGPAASPPEGIGLEPGALHNALLLLEKHGLVEPRAMQEPVSETEHPQRGPQPAEATNRTLQLHVTQRCNLRCATCYVADFLQHQPDPLDLREIERILGIAATSGYSRVDITGGEPLLRRDLIEILQLARSLFRIVTLTTNGIALTPSLCAKLDGLLDAVDVSLDGATAEVNDSIRGAGAYVRAMAGIRTLEQSGFPMRRVGLMPTVTRMNYEKLENLVDVAAELGTRVSYGFFMPTGRGSCHQDRLLLEPKEMKDLFERTAARRRAQMERTDGHGSEAPPAAEQMCFTEVRTSCRVDTIIDIQADGSIFPCPNLNQPEHQLGNILELSDQELAQLLGKREARRRFVERTVDKVPGCSSCDARYFCAGGCMANAYAQTGDLYGQDPCCGFYKAMWRCHGPLAEEYHGSERVDPLRATSGRSTTTDAGSALEQGVS